MSLNKPTSSSNDQDSGPWYKQFWAWFVLAPLITVMLAWIPFMTIVLKGADDVVIDNYYREGRMYNQRLDQDHHAQRLGIEGDLRFDLEVGEVLLTISSSDPQYTLPTSLQLYLDHPVEADYDQVITLHQIRDGYYRGDLEQRISHRWYLRLYPHDSDPAVTSAEEAAKRADSWRIIGEFNLDQADRLHFGSTE